MEKNPAVCISKWMRQAAADANTANEVRLYTIGEETAGIAALGLALWGASKFLSPSEMTQKTHELRNEVVEELMLS
jgi:hypothetical protein